ncbi:MAG TPA: sigma-70 family RNA polymerase sigma factor [Bdellovibrio sp.]|uniref:RNA polymerase sigma factor n=1 Tax=Bdellovibrio sp. TaxID=28201 RepID=UPI002F1F3F62
MFKSDEEIIKIWKKDPHEGFRLIYDRYAGSLLRFVYRFTGNQEQAEEILQDVFTEVLKSNFETANFNIKAWLFTIAKNKSLNFERKKKREIPSDQLIQDAVDLQSTEETIATHQIYERIHSIQSQLPKDLAQTWHLRKQGLDYKEIASELSIPIGTVKSRFSRIADFFKKELKIERQD